MSFETETVFSSKEAQRVLNDSMNSIFFSRDVVSPKLEKHQTKHRAVLQMELDAKS